jgi:hypothetical protein
MLRIVAPFTAFLLSACADGLPPAGTYREAVIASGGTEASGWSITYIPARTERRYAGREMVICSTQWMLWRYIDWGTRDGCWVGYLAGNPERNYYNGVRVWYDRSPVRPRFYTEQ